MSSKNCIKLIIKSYFAIHSRCCSHGNVFSLTCAKAAGKSDCRLLCIPFQFTISRCHRRKRPALTRIDTAKRSVSYTAIFPSSIRTTRSAICAISGL